MTEVVSPARAIYGAVQVPGDKSISHRYAMLTAIAHGTSKIFNYSGGADCHSTLGCMRALGVEWSFASENGSDVLSVEGKGTGGLRAPEGALDAGNSGSTIRMLSGILAGQPFSTTIGGDESLSKRPMKRVIAPLEQMGARLEAVNGQFPPLTIHGTAQLRGIEYQTPVASAQVKSCVLLAGLYAQGETAVREAVVTRDHTEIALHELGADISIQPRYVRLRGPSSLEAKTLVVPGDLSGAAFFLVAALLLPDSELVISGVGLNPTRTALLDTLRGMGAQIRPRHLEEANGELIGALEVKTSPIKGGVIEGATTAALIDEIPILAILGARSRDGLTVRDAGELRVKETDRIDTIERNLRAMGVEIETTTDGLRIPGRQHFHAAVIESCGDHRIAMAFSIAALLADGACQINDAQAASVSFPDFYDKLRSVAKS